MSDQPNSVSSRGGQAVEITAQQIEIQNNQLRTKHIRTLEVLERTQDEARNLAIRCEQLESQLLSCQELHELARDAKGTIEKVKKKCQQTVNQKTTELKNAHKQEIDKITDEYTIELVKFQLDNETLSEKVIKLESLIDRMKDRMKDQDASYEKLREANEALTLQINSEKKDSSSLSVQINTLMSKALKQEEANYALTQRNEMLETQLEDASDRIQILTNDLEAAQLSDKADFKIKELKSKNKELKGAVKELINNKVSLEEEIQKANLYVENFGKLKRDMEGNVSEKEERVKEVEKDNEELKLKMKEMEETIKTLKSQVKSKTEPRFKEFVMAMRENRQLKHENNSLKGSLDNISSTQSLGEIKYLPKSGSKGAISRDHDDDDSENEEELRLDQIPKLEYITHDHSKGLPSSSFPKPNYHHSHSKQTTGASQCTSSSSPARFKLQTVVTRTGPAVPASSSSTPSILKR
eukprot:Nk52_evm1s2092 gene=Nk52_evmTU1s2092